ncbi:MAG: restriction endonuclease subunit S [Candidatus Neptunochlamydia sp.]|nr:restriction endonuclease subunit S [Candidatus Neptunochlamydia sp.]
MKEGWETKKLGDLFSFKNGRAFKKKDWGVGGLPIIRIQNLNNFIASFNYYSGEYSDDILIKDGDLLFSWSGTVGSSFGPHIWNRGWGLLNQHIFRVVFKKKINKQYVYYGLHKITENIERQVSGAVGLAHITKEKLNQFSIALPTIDEQKRLVSLLDKSFEVINTAIANTKKGLENAKELFESYLNGVFEKGGEGWEIKALSEFCTIQIGKTPRRAVKSYWDENKETKNVWLSIADLKYVQDKKVFDSREYLSNTGATVSKLVPKGTLLLSFKLTLGRVAFAARNLYTNEAIAAIFIKNETTILSEYLYYFFQYYNWDKAVDGDTKIKGKTLNKAKLKEIKVKSPKVEEQKRLVAFLDKLSEHTQNLQSIYQKKLAALEELKQSLLHQAFNGDL